MGKIKTYKANTNVSINVVLANKKNLHITFSPLTNGSSTFTTDNEDVMDAIERHYNFGKLFRLHSVTGESKKPAKAVEMKAKKTAKETEAEAEEDANVVDGENNAPEPAPEDAVDETAEEKETDAEAEEDLRKVKVSDLAAAKDYLADKFDISRTALRSKKAIVEQAAAHGIWFEGLE